MTPYAFWTPTFQGQLGLQSRGQGRDQAPQTVTVILRGTGFLKPLWGLIRKSESRAWRGCEIMSNFIAMPIKVDRA